MKYGVPDVRAVWAHEVGTARMLLGVPIDIVHNAWSTPLDPRISPEDKAKWNFTNSRAIIDACRPFYWRDKFPPVNTPSAAVMKKAREKFGYLLE